MAKSIKLGMDLCEALGLEANKVLKLDLRIRLGHLPVVDVELAVDTDDGVDRVLMKYELVEKEPVDAG